MLSDWLPALAAAVGTATGGVVTYIVARRLSSGTTRTSDAKVIWDASETLRHDLTAALKAQGDELAAVKANLAVIVADLATIRAENTRLADEVAILRRTLER